MSRRHRTILTLIVIAGAAYGAGHDIAVRHVTIWTSIYGAAAVGLAWRLSLVRLGRRLPKPRGE